MDSKMYKTDEYSETEPVLPIAVAEVSSKVSEIKSSCSTILKDGDSESVNLGLHPELALQESTCKIPSEISFSEFKLDKSTESKLHTELNKESDDSLQSNVEVSISDNCGNKVVSEELEGGSSILKDLCTERCYKSVTTELETSNFLDERSAELERMTDVAVYSDSSDEESQEKECKSHQISDQAEVKETPIVHVIDSLISKTMKEKTSSDQNTFLGNFKEDLKLQLINKATDVQTQSLVKSSDSQEQTKSNNEESPSEVSVNLDVLENREKILKPLADQDFNNTIETGEVQDLKVVRKQIVFLYNETSDDQIRSNVLKTPERALKQKVSSAPDSPSSLKEEIPTDSPSSLKEEIPTDSPSSLKEVKKDSTDNENVRNIAFAEFKEIEDFNTGYEERMILAEFDHNENNESAKSFFSDETWERLRVWKCAKTLRNENRKTNSSLLPVKVKERETLLSAKHLNQVERKRDAVLPLDSDTETSKNSSSVKTEVSSQNIEFPKQESEINSKQVCIKLQSDPFLQLSLSKYMANLEELGEFEKKMRSMEQYHTLSNDDNSSVDSLLSNLNSALKDNYSDLQENLDSVISLPKVIETNTVHEQMEKEDDPLYSDFMEEIYNLKCHDTKINKWPALKQNSEDPLLKHIVERHFRNGEETENSKNVELKVLSEGKFGNIKYTSKVFENEAKEVSKQKTTDSTNSVNLDYFPDNSDSDKEKDTMKFSSFIIKAERERKLNEGMIELIKEIESSFVGEKNKEKQNDVEIEKIKKNERSELESVNVKAVRTSGRWTMIDFENNSNIPPEYLGIFLEKNKIREKKNLELSKGARISDSSVKLFAPTLSGNSRIEEKITQLELQKTAHDCQQNIQRTPHVKVEQNEIEILRSLNIPDSKTSASFETKTLKTKSNFLGPNDGKQFNSELITVALVKEIIQPKMQESGFENNFEESPVLHGVKNLSEVNASAKSDSNLITVALVKEIIRPRIPITDDIDLGTSIENSPEHPKNKNEARKFSNISNPNSITITAKHVKITTNLVKVIIRPKTKKTDFKSSTDESLEDLEAKRNLREVDASTKADSNLTVALVKEIIRPKIPIPNDTDLETSAENSPEHHQNKSDERKFSNILNPNSISIIADVVDVFVKSKIHVINDTGLETSTKNSPEHPRNKSDERKFSNISSPNSITITANVVNVFVGSKAQVTDLETRTENSPDHFKNKNEEGKFCNTSSESNYPITVDLVKEIIRPKTQETDFDFESSTEESPKHPDVKKNLSEVNDSERDNSVSNSISVALVKEIILPKIQITNDTDIETRTESSPDHSENEERKIGNTSSESNSIPITVDLVKEIIRPKIETVDTDLDSSIEESLDHPQIQ